ncbi:MAG: signal recognition particle-docking protein FtsY [Clostridiales bacterium]
MGFFSKLTAGLSKTRDNLIGKVNQVFTGRKIDEDLFEELEEALIQGDVGVETSLQLADTLRKRVKEEKISDSSLLQGILEEEIASILTREGQGSGIDLEDEKLNIILMTGVNGAGKTTTIGKLASRYRQEDRKVLLAAADTFRAAATEQLAEWAKRADVDLIRQGEGADPGAVVFDACQAALARKTQVLIVDTAGRLQNKSNLMDELKKIRHIIDREAPQAICQTLLVLDAGTGQNAISQAKLFGQAAPLTGIILTKLDGTAKGGAIIGIVNESSLPVKMVGVGEGIDDLKEFDPREFAQALFADLDSVEVDE